MNQLISEKIAKAKLLELHKPKEIKRKIETGARNGTFFKPELVITIFIFDNS